MKTSLSACILAFSLAWGWLSVPSALAAGPGAAINFTLSTLDGSRLSLSQFRGRVVILEFFATWCRICKTSLTEAEELRKAYEAEGLSVVGYSLDQEARKKVLTYTARLGLRFPVVMGTPAHAARLARVKHLPTTLIIGPKGRVIKRWEGAVSRRTMLAAVRPYLGRNATSSPRVAQSKLRRPGERRFHMVRALENTNFGGQRGVFINIEADITDIVNEQGLWFALHLQPQVPTTQGVIDFGRAKVLYQRVDHTWKNQFTLFVSCDQLPATPHGGYLRSRVSIMGPQRAHLEKSNEFVINSPGCFTANAQ